MDDNRDNNSTGSLDEEPILDDVLLDDEVEPMEKQKHEDKSKLSFRYQAARVLANISTGTRNHVYQLIDRGAINLLVSIVASGEDAAEQAVRALGNIALEEPATRDEVLRQGALSAILHHLHPGTPIELLRQCVITYHNICSTFNTGSAVEFALVSPGLPHIAELLTVQDEEVLTEACMTLFCISKMSREHIDTVQATPMLMARLVALLDHNSEEFKIRALLVLEAMLEENNTQRIACQDAGCLGNIINLLYQSMRRPVKGSLVQYHAMRVLTSISTGTRDHIHALIYGGAISPLVVFLQWLPYCEMVAEQAAMTLGNIARMESATRDEVLKQGALYALLPYLSPDTPPRYLRTYVWLYCIMCGGDNDVELELVSPGLPHIAKLLAMHDEVILTHACAALSYLTETPEYIDTVQAIPTLMEHLMSLLDHSSLDLRTEAVIILGNMLSGTNTQMDICLSFNCLDKILDLLHTSMSLIKDSIPTDSKSDLQNIATQPTNTSTGTLYSTAVNESLCPDRCTTLASYKDLFSNCLNDNCESAPQGLNTDLPASQPPPFISPVVTDIDDKFTNPKDLFVRALDLEAIQPPLIVLDTNDKPMLFQTTVEDLPKNPYANISDIEPLCSSPVRNFSDSVSSQLVIAKKDEEYDLQRNSTGHTSSDNNDSEAIESSGDSDSEAIESSDNNDSEAIESSDDSDSEVIESSDNNDSKAIEIQEPEEQKNSTSATNAAVSINDNDFKCGSDIGTRKKKEGKTSRQNSSPCQKKNNDIKSSKKPRPVTCNIKCRYFCLSSFSADDRQKLCEDWKMMDYEAQKQFLLNQIVPMPIKTFKADIVGKKHREATYQYHLNNKYSKKRVCKEFFLKTLCISNGPVRTAFKNRNKFGNFEGTDRRGSRDPINKTKAASIKKITDHIRNFLPGKNSIKKPFLDEKPNISKMYKHYRQKLESTDEKPSSLYIYKKILKSKFNSSFFTGKVLCTRYDSTDRSVHNKDTHTRKNAARAAKNNLDHKMKGSDSEETNGLIAQLKALQMLSNISKLGHTITYNTCAFNCLAHLLAVAFSLKQNIQTFFITLNDRLSNLIIAIAQNKANTNDIRNDLISLHYGNHTNASEINCKCNITFVVERYLSENYSKTTSIKKYSQSSCSVNNQNLSCDSGFVFINIDSIRDLGIHSLQQSAIQCMSRKNRCNEGSCSGYNYYNYSFSQFIAIELNSCSKYRLEEFPKEINLFGNTYSHPSVVEYLEYNEHYRVHCFIGNAQWLTFDDLRKKVNSQEGTCAVLPHCIIYSKC